MQINRFYIGMLLVLVLLAIFVVVVLRGIFGAISLSGEIDASLLDSTTPRLDRVKIDRAIEAVEDRQFSPLDL